MAMIDDDGDDVAINEISNNMKLPIYAVLVGRVSFLHPLTVVFFPLFICLFSCFVLFFDWWCLSYVVFSLGRGVKRMRAVQIQKQEHL